MLGFGIPTLPFGSIDLLSPNLGLAAWVWGIANPAASTTTVAAKLRTAARTTKNFSS